MSANDFKNVALMTKTAEEAIEIFGRMVGKSANMTTKIATQLVQEWLKRSDSKAVTKAILAMLGEVKSQHDNLAIINVDKNAAKTFSEELQYYTKRPTIIADFVRGDRVADGIGDFDMNSIGGINMYENMKNPAFLTLQSENEKIELAKMAAYIRNGINVELNMKYAKTVLPHIAQENSIKKISGLKPTEFEALKRRIQKLPNDKKFTLIFEQKISEAGTESYDIQFLSYTNGKRKYNIENMVKSFLTEEKIMNESHYGIEYIQKLNNDIEERDRLIKENILERDNYLEDINLETESLVCEPELKLDIKNYIYENYFKKTNLDIKNDLKEMLEVKDIDANELFHKLDQELNAEYLMKATAYKDKKTGKTILKFDRDNYLKADKNLEINEKYHEPRVIGNSKEDISDLQIGRIHKYQEADSFMQSNIKANNQFFVKITNKEFQQIQNGSGKLFVEQIAYFNTKEPPELLNQDGLDFSKELEELVNKANAYGNLDEKDNPFQDSLLTNLSPELKESIENNRNYYDEIKTITVDYSQEYQKELEERNRELDRNKENGNRSNDKVSIKEPIFDNER